MHTKDLAIGILSTTAVILLVGLIVIQSRPDPVYGSSMNAQGGDYLLSTGQVDPSRELLYVIDAASERLLVYRYDVNRKQITIEAGERLAKLREAASESSAPSSTKGRRGRSR